MSFLMSCRTIQDLGSQEIIKYKKILKTSYIDKLVLSLPPKIKILLIVAKNF